MGKRWFFSLRTEDIRTECSHAWYMPLPSWISYGDRENDLFSSRVVLLEDGIELGPAHAPHDDIRMLGAGRYSHWKRQLWFSTSDNSSPLDNARRYDLLLFDEPSGTPEPLGPTQGTDRLPASSRIALARAAYRQIWPHSKLPDIGRRIDADKAFEIEFRHVSPEADDSYERKYNLDQLFQLVAHVDGDVAECGSYRGASAYFLGRRIIGGQLAKKLYLFDSFDGLSAPDTIDGLWWKQGDLRCEVDALRDNLRRLPDTRFIEILPGWIPERFNAVAGNKFCFVHIDVDLAQPTADSLAFFYPRMAKDGILVFDDYGCDTCPGVTAVVDAFFSDKREPIVNLASGGAFVVVRHPADDDSPPASKG
jgi:hypothetical protein